MTSIPVRDANGNVREFIINDDPVTGAIAALVLAAIQQLKPAASHQLVTPSDSAALSGVRSLYIGTGGTVVVTMGGADVTYNCGDGAILPIAAEKVKAASTATQIVAWK